MNFQILIATPLLILGVSILPNVESAHFTGADTEVVLKECKEKNMTIWSEEHKVLILDFCDKVEELTSTFLQEFIHAIISGVNTTAEGLIAEFDDDIRALLLEYVGKL